MKQSFLFVAAVCAGLGALVHTVSPQAAGAAASGDLAYDEIVKFAITASPPPPGSFANDYVAMTSPQAAATTSPAAKKRGLFGSLGNISVGDIARTAVNGGNAGDLAAATARNAAANVTGDAVDSAISGMLEKQMQPIADSLARFANGTVERHQFYNNWERADNVSLGTATIVKCDLHERIELDLNHKTYHIVRDDAGVAASQSSTSSVTPTRGCPTTAAPQQAGTGTLVLTTTANALAAVPIGGANAPGLATSTTMAIEHATGSCRNGSFTVASKTYYSGYGVPHAYCPLPRSYQHPSTPQQMVTQDSGGCKLTMQTHASVGAAGKAPATLPVYELMTMSGNDSRAGGAGSGTNGGSFSFLIERGNFRTLGPGDAALFEVPAGFKQT